MWPSSHATNRPRAHQTSEKSSPAAFLFFPAGLPAISRFFTVLVVFLTVWQVSCAVPQPSRAQNTRKPVTRLLSFSPLPPSRSPKIFAALAVILEAAWSILRCVAVFQPTSRTKHQKHHHQLVSLSPPLQRSNFFAALVAFLEVGRSFCVMWPFSPFANRLRAHKHPKIITSSSVVRLG